MPKSLKESAAEQEQAKANLEQARKVARLESKCKGLEQTNKDLLQSLEVAEQRADRISQLSERTDWEAWGRDVRKSGKIFATAILPVSDLHAEEVVEAREVAFLNAYNLEEAGRRFERLMRKQVEYVARYVWMANEVIWPILGDLVNGVLREQALEANDASVMQTLAILGEWFDQAIDYQLREYKALGLPVKKIIIPCVCGNHGRAYRKLGDRIAWKNSYEWGFYQGLAARWAREPRVDFRIADADFCYLTIFGRTIRFHHGDAIQYGGGVLGLSVPVHKKINRWNTAIRADLDVFGHFHQLTWGRDFVCNGSVVGYNSYAKRIACEYEPPQQAFMLFDKKWGLRQVTKILCVDEQPEAMTRGAAAFDTVTLKPGSGYRIRIQKPAREKRPKSTAG